jgi:predicted RNase H-like HicB family nuclease
MKKTTINILVKGEGKTPEKREVAGYEYILSTGHETVVHKHHEHAAFWVVSIRPLGLSMAQGNTRQEAINNAEYRAKKHGKAVISQLIENNMKQYKKYL